MLDPIRNPNSRPNFQIGIQPQHLIWHPNQDTTSKLRLDPNIWCRNWLELPTRDPTFKLGVWPRHPTADLGPVIDSRPENHPNTLLGTRLRHPIRNSTLIPDSGSNIQIEIQPQCESWVSNRGRASLELRQESNLGLILSISMRDLSWVESWGVRLKKTFEKCFP